MSFSAPKENYNNDDRRYVVFDRHFKRQTKSAFVLSFREHIRRF